MIADCTKATPIRCALLCLVASWALAGCQTHVPPRYAELPPTSLPIPIQQLACSAGCSAPVQPVALAQLAGEHSLDEYIAASLAVHPAVQAARWEVESAAWQVPIAGALEDPKLNLTALPAPIQTAAGRQQAVVGVSQNLPVRDKRARKEAIACAAADAARARLDAAQRDVIAKVRKTYAELIFRQAALQILNDDRELLQEIAQIIVALYKTNKVNQQDIAQAELAQLTVEQELIAARQQLHRRKRRWRG